MLHGDAGVGDLPVRDRRRAGVRGPPPVDGVDVRVRLARRRLADPARVRAPRPAADGVRRRDGAAAPPRADAGLRRPAATRSPATAGAGSTTSTWPRPSERAHIETGTRIIRELTGGAWPLGWYTGRDSPNTKRLVADHGGYEYDSDYYGDDLPFWMPVEKSDGTTLQRLIVPYTLDTNDMRFASPQGFNTGDHFFTYLKDAFDVLYAEGDEAAEDAVDRHALPAARPAGAVSRAAALPRPRAGARPGLDRAPDRHRAPLDAGVHPAPARPRWPELCVDGCSIP